LKTFHCRMAIFIFVVALALVGLRPTFAGRITDETSSADWSGLLVAAQHQFGVGNYPAAIATLRAVISQNPLSAEAFYWLGRCYFEIGDFDSAISHAEKSVTLQPANSEYQDWLGRAYGAKADRDKSFFTARKVKKQFQQAVQLDPSNIAARRDLQEFCMQAPWIVGGSNDEARAQVDAIAKIDPVEGHLARAAFYAESYKRLDLAENEYKQVLAAKPDKVGPYLDAATFFRDQNKVTDMNSAVEAAAQVNPSDPRLAFYRAAGMILARSDLGRAEWSLKSYLASTPERSDWPSHASAREWLGRLYEAQGKRAEAAEQYRASLQLEPERKTARGRLEKLEKSSW
jgi:tetratricopeptide (TPR) repeat protein